MNKRIIALILCIGLILGNTASVHAGESMTSVADEITAASSGDESAETATEPVSDVNVDTQIEEGSALVESSEQATIVDNNLTEQLAVDDEENINQLEDENSDDVLDEDIVESYSVAFLKAEGGILQYSESMVLPSAEESSDVNILDLRCFESGTEVRIKAIPEEGFETDTITIDYLDSNQQVELVEANGEYVFTMPAEDIDIHVTFVQIEVSEEVLDEAEEIEELPMMTMALNSDASPEGWEYDDSTNTLTLTNYVAEEVENTAAGTAQIYSDGDLNLVITGNNTLNYMADYGIYCEGNLTVSGNGTLSISNSSTGIYAKKAIVYDSAEVTIVDSLHSVCAHWGDLTINSGTLTVDHDIYSENGGSIIIESGEISAQQIISDENITINNGTITLSGTLEADNFLSIKNGTIEVNGGIVTEELQIDGGSVTARNSSGYGISSRQGDKGDIHKITGGTVYAEGSSGGITYWVGFDITGGEVTAVGTGENSYGMNGGWVTISDGTVNLSGGSAGMYYNAGYGGCTFSGGDIHIESQGCGFLTSSYGSLTINGGTVTINAEEYGIKANGYGGKVTITGGESYIYGKTQAISTSEGLFVSNGLSIYSGESVQNKSRADAYYGETYCEVILDRTIENTSIRLSSVSYEYDGEEKTPNVSVTFEGLLLSESQDYSLEYKNNINAGTATVNITGKGDYTGMVSVPFTITPKAVTPTVILSTTQYVYDGSAKKPTLTVKYGETELVSGTDYTIAYSSNTAVGKAAAKVTLKGNYAGTKTVNYTIVPPATTLSSVTNTATGVKVSWTKVTSAEGYYIYRATGSGTASKIATITSNATLTYVDTSAKTNNTKYSYYVVAYKTADGTTYSSAKSATKFTYFMAKMAAPTLSNTAAGVKVTWKQSVGANGYYIYRSTGSGSASKVKTVTSGSTLTYTDTGAKTNNTKYSYYVVAYKTVSSTTYKSANSATKVTYFMSKMAAPTLANAATGIKVTWKKSTGANGYYIYRKAGSGSYSLVKTITSGSTLTYTDTGAKTNGTKYTYYVVAYKTVSSVKYKSSNSATKVLYFVSRPAISSLKSTTAKKMTVAWAKNAKSTGYQIQYSLSSTFASGNKTVTVKGAANLSKVIGSLTSGKTYYVRIRTYKTVSGTNYYSLWSAVKKIKVFK